MRKEDSTNSINRVFLHKSCKVNEALDLISGRWKAIIMFHIAEKANRFSLLKTALLKQVSDQTLGRQLKELEQSNLIGKILIPGFPPRVDYYLTAQGEALLPILNALNEWTEHYYPTNLFEQK